MLTPEERLMIGLKFLERFKPDLQSRRNQPPRRPVEQTDDSKINTSEFNRSEADNQDDEPPSIQSVIDQTGPFSPGSLILGSCEDGLPFILDLTNPAPGALLISGDEGSGKTRLLHSILKSAVALNSPAQVSFSLVVSNPEEYTDLSHSNNYQEMHTPGDRGVDDLVQALEAAVEQRRYGTTRGPSMILAIDNLASFLQYSSDEGTRLLHTILKHGPRSRIWTLATLRSTDAEQIDERLVFAFRTRLVGKIMDPMLAAYLANDPNSGAENLISGSQFCVPFGDDWIRFWVCGES
jgi:hypothetical protein